jgi:cobaltochelatase CobS
MAVNAGPWMKEQATRQQLHFLAGKLGVTETELLQYTGCPKLKGEASELINRVINGEDPVVLMQERAGIVPEGPGYWRVSEQLREYEVNVSATKRDLTQKIFWKRRESWSKKRGLKTYAATSWDFQSVMQACKDFRLDPVMNSTYRYRAQGLVAALPKLSGVSEQSTEPTPAPPTATSAVSEATVREMVERILREPKADLERYAESVKTTFTDDAARALTAKMAPVIEGLVAEQVEKLVPRRVEVVVPGKQSVILDDILHEAFNDVLALTAANLPVLMIGPAGCGKTHTAAQVAKALGYEDHQFAAINCTSGMSEGKLVGSLVPIGDGGRFEYLRTDFVRLYEEGGLFLLDELDAADSNVLLAMNTAIANAYLPLPFRVGQTMAKRHPDFRLIASANTFGTGANRMYVGRNQLDEATLDRFRTGQVEMDYSRKLEERLVHDEQWLTACWSVRDAVNRHKLRRVVSTRFIVDSVKMKAAGWSNDKLLRKLTSGWSKDEMEKVGLGRLATS